MWTWLSKVLLTLGYDKMPDRVVTIGEDVHVFKRAGLKTFEHYLRPRWSKSSRGEVRINGQMSSEDVDIWVKAHQEAGVISLGEERAALEEIGRTIDENPLRIFVPKPPKEKV